MNHSRDGENVNRREVGGTMVGRDLRFAIADLRLIGVCWWRLHPPLDDLCAGWETCNATRRRTRSSVRTMQPVSEHIDQIIAVGNELMRAGRAAEAEAKYRRAVEMSPGNDVAWHMLGIACVQQGRAREAAAAIFRAVKINPSEAAYASNLGNVLSSLGRVEDAVVAYRRAVGLRPEFAEAWNNLGIGLHRLGRLDEAVEAFGKSLTIRPGHAQTLSNLGNVLKEAGEIDLAMRGFESACAAGNDRAVASQRLLASYFHPAYGPQELLDMHVDWGRRFAPALGNQNYPNEPDPGRKLRVGYVAHELRNDQLGRFLLPLITHHDRAGFEVHVYCDVTRPDAVTESLRGAVGTWRDTARMSDEALADQIRADGIDILVDLWLHCANNRLMAFARKPAPVQVTYLAYCGTTGLSAMDYRLTDVYLDPPGVGDEMYVEKSVRLPRCYWCYAPAKEAGKVAELPAKRNGYVTFGCLNHFGKVSQPTREVWRRLMREAPGSRLIVHAPEGGHRERFKAFFAEGGVEPGRVEFVGVMPLEKYFACYGRIDIALDPFPYAGGTTTCDALWMGVPVVTLAGRTAVGRGGVSILSNVGLGELIAGDEVRYVRVATELPGDLARLAALRATMRQRLEASPLLDANGFAGDVEAAYRVMWEQWCRTICRGEALSPP